MARRAHAHTTAAMMYNIAEGDEDFDDDDDADDGEPGQQQTLEDIEGELEGIEAEVAQLQDEGAHSDAVMGMEQAFVLCIEAFGPSSGRTAEACERLTTRC